MSTTKAQVELPRFFAGGAIAAVIAAVAGVVTRGVVNALLDADDLSPGDLVIPTSFGADQYEILSVGQTAVVSLIFGLAAVVVLFLFVQAVPRPITMFNTLGVLFLVASLLPILTFDDPPVTWWMKGGLALVHLVVGFTILGLLSGVARSTVRFVRVTDEHDHPQQGYPQQQPYPQQQGYPPQQPSYPQQQQPPAGYQPQQGWPQQPQQQPPQGPPQQGGYR